MASTRSRPNHPAATVAIEGVAEPIVTAAEQAAILAAISRNAADWPTRTNKNPEATLLRAGFVTCGHCGFGLAAKNPPASDPSRSPTYRCTDAGKETADAPSRRLRAAVWTPRCGSTWSKC